MHEISSRDFDLQDFPYQEGGSDQQAVRFQRPSRKEIVLFCGHQAPARVPSIGGILNHWATSAINQDTLKRLVSSLPSRLPLPTCRLGRANIVSSKDKCFKAAADMLREENMSLLVCYVSSEDMLRGPLVRSRLDQITQTRTRMSAPQWIDLAKKNKVPIRCIWLKTPNHVCEHNDAVRSMNKKVWSRTWSFIARLQPPDTI